MKNKKVILENETGLHARPAAELVKIASKYKSEINLNVNGKNYNAKSMLGVMSAGIKTKTEIEIICDGEDEEQALEEIVSGFENKFGE